MTGRGGPRTDQSELHDDPLIQGLLSRCDFPERGSSVACAVSGGADSVALLVLAVAAGLEVTAIHVDHGIREGSDSEARFVDELAHRFGAGFESRSCKVDNGPDLEARARQARHSLLPPDTLFGHTADDQAETVVLRLLRGTGPAGLAAMRPDRHPMLRIRRSETLELCERLRVDPFNDPSNCDPRFRRNRVRNEVLPLLSDVADRDVTSLLCRLAELSAEQANLVSSLAAIEDATDSKALAALHPTVAAEVLRRWWTEQTGSVYPPDSAAISRIMDVARGNHIGCEVGGGWSVRRSVGRLYLTRGGAHESSNAPQD